MHADHRECTRLSRVYTAWLHGGPPPDDEVLSLSSEEAAAEADRIVADNADLQSISGRAAQ